MSNAHVQDMRIYLIRGSVPIALGTVETGTRRTFVLSTALLGHAGVIRLMADPLGSVATYRSDWIPAVAGDLVEWRLAPSLPLSTFTVRSPRLPPGLTPPTW